MAEAAYILPVTQFPKVLTEIADIASKEHKLPVAMKHFIGDERKSQLVIFPPPERDFEISHPYQRNHGVHLMEFIVVAGDLSCHLKVLRLPWKSDTILGEQSFTRSRNSSRDDWRGYLQLEYCSIRLNFYKEGLKSKFKVCEGRGSIETRQDDLCINIRNAIEQGLTAGNFFTFSDCRFRAYNCRLLVDEDANQNETKCSSCLEPTAAVPMPLSPPSPSTSKQKKTS